MRTRIAVSFAVVLGLALSSAPAFARRGHGGYSPQTKHHVFVQHLGTERRTGNSSGNAELAEPDRKIVDDPNAPQYGNEIVDPPSEQPAATPKPKAKPKAKAKTTAKAEPKTTAE